MAKYIPLDAVLAELKRRLHFDNNWIEDYKRWQTHTNGVSSVYYRMIGSKNACESFLDFIETLEVKEVDWEKEYKDFIKSDNGRSMFETAKHFFELGMAASNKQSDAYIEGVKGSYTTITK